MIKAYKAKWIITAEDTVLEDYVMVVKNDKIIYLLPFSEFCDNEIILKDLGNVVITPGFIDLFTRLELTRINDLRQISIKSFLKKIFFCIKNSILFFQTDKKSYHRKFLKTQFEYKSWSRRYRIKSIKQGVKNLVLSGTTTFAQRLDDFSCYKFYNKLAMRKFLFFETMSDSQKKSKSEFFKLVRRIKNLSHKKSDKTYLGIAPKSVSTVEFNLLRALGRLSKKINILLMLNFMQFEDEANWLKGATSKVNIYQKLNNLKQFLPVNTEYSPVEYIDKTGLLNENTLLLNANYLTKDDVDLLAQKDANVVYLPRVNDKLDNRKLPLNTIMGQFREKFGFATDSIAYNYDNNLLNEVKFANQNMELNAKDMIKHLTIIPAKILKIDDITGSIKVGKQADFNVFELFSNDIEELTKTPTLKAVFIAGSQYVKDGEIVKSLS